MEDTNKHPYNKVYPFEAILKEVKELLFPTILKQIPFYNVFIVLGILSKEEYAEMIYKEIMALGYNGEDVEATVNCLMPARNQLIYQGPEEADKVNMSFRLYEVLKDYSHQVKAFEVFYKMKLKPHNKVIQNVKKQILPLKYEEYYEDYSDMYKKVWIKHKILDLRFELKKEEYQEASVEEMEGKLIKIIKEINKVE